MENSVQAKKEISTFKRLLGIYIDDIKKNKYFLIFTTMLSVFIFPLLNYIMDRSSIQEAGYDEDEVMVMMSGVFLLTLVISFSVVNNLKYLHKKRQADLVESMPIGKRAYLIEKLIFGMTKTFLPLVSSVVCAEIYYFSDKHIAFMIFRIAVIMSVFILANLAFGTLISVCCGKTVDAAVTYIVINLFIVMLVVEFFILPSGIIPGIRDGSDSVLGHLIFYFTPVSGIFMGLANVSLYVDYVTKGLVIFWAVAAAVMFAVEIIIIKYRKTEVAEDKFAFEKLLTVIKVLSAVGVGIIAGLMIEYTLGPSNAVLRWLLFYFVVAVSIFITHLVLYSVYDRGSHKFIKELKKMLISFAGVAVIITVVQLGLFGMDKKCPDAKDVKYAKIEIERFTVLDGLVYTDDDEELEAFENGREIHHRENTFDQCYEDVSVPFKCAYKTEDIQAVIDAHKEILDQLDEDKTFGLYDLPTSYSDCLDKDDLGKFRFNVTYVMKDGTEMERRYEWYDLSDDFIAKIDSIPKYGELMCIDVKNISYVDIERRGEGDAFIDREDHDLADWTKKFTDCYIKEYEALKNSGNDVDEDSRKTYWLEFTMNGGVDFDICVSENMPESYEMVKQLIKYEW